MGTLGTLLGALKGVGERFGAVLGRSWGPDGTHQGPSWAVTGPLGVVLRPSWGLLGPAGGDFKHFEMKESTIQFNSMTA